MNVFELFDSIRKKPEMYLHDRSLKELYVFYNAFLFTKSIYNEIEEEDSLFRGEFDRWIIKIYKLENLSHLNWKNSIAIFHGDGEKGFFEFFNLLDTFINNHNLSLKDSN